MLIALPRFISALQELLNNKIMLIALLTGYLIRTGKLTLLKNFFNNKVLAKVHVRNTINQANTLR
jgi:hypothetical protein